MDEDLEKLIEELGEAINHAIQESGEINETLDRIRALGHDVYLILEASIGFKDKEEGDEAGNAEFKEISIEQRLSEISPEDRQFLRSLNIKFDNDE